MSATARRRPAFDPAALGNIDELLPALPTLKTESGTVTTPTPVQEPASPETRHAQTVADRATVTPAATTAPARQEQTTTATRPNAAEVALAPDVYHALRALTLHERATTPTTARSYGQVALDAIETHAAHLATHWNATPAPTSGLFSRVSTGTPRRRRHAEAPARVPLAGIIASDVAKLDELATTWGAGSRSALVEAALSIYLHIA